MAQPPLPPPPNPYPSTPGWGASPEYVPPPAYAGFWIRVLASIIDSIVLVPFYIPLAIRMVDRMNITSSTSFSSMDFGRMSGDLIGWALALQLVRYLYEFLMIGQWNATVGKFALGIRVRQTDGSPATWREAALRPESSRIKIAVEWAESALRPVLELVIGVLGISLATLLDDLWMLWDKQKQTLHDNVAGTIVVAK